MPILLLNPSAAPAERYDLISVIGGELLPSLRAAGKVGTFPKHEREVTSLGLWSVPGNFQALDVHVKSSCPGVGKAPMGCLPGREGSRCLGPVQGGVRSV